MLLLDETTCNLPLSFFNVQFVTSPIGNSCIGSTNGEIKALLMGHEEALHEKPSKDLT